MQEKINQSFPFMKGKVFINHMGPSKKYRTTGNTYLCIIPNKVKDGDSCITVNDIPVLLEKDIPYYLKPLDTYWFSGSMILSMTFCSPTNSVGEEEIID